MSQSAVRVRHNLVERLAEARSVTDSLFGLVRPEALYDRPIPERHRIVFYIGHLEAFDHNLLAPVLNLKSADSGLDKLFAFGIDPVGTGLPSDQPSDWPRLDEVGRYNRRVRETLDRSLENGAAGELLRDGQRLQVAVEHRLMHAETLAYMFHQLPFDCKIPQRSRGNAETTSATRHMVDIPAGTATLGLSRATRSFGWDNEFESTTVPVPAFRIDARKVSNGEFLKFVQEGGYEDSSLWTKEAWEWISRDGIRHPNFWTRQGNSWQFRAMFREMPLPLDWPVYVSHAEATAYARWAGKSLPTEAQFHRAAFGSPHGQEFLYPWGNTAPSARYGNFDFGSWDPLPVNSFAQGRSAFGVEDLVGNGWEWTSTPFQPLPGFQPFSFYPGYSANFFDGKHYVMKGGSARTAACMLRRSFRNWFQPHYPYIYAGFRCVAD